MNLVIFQKSYDFYLYLSQITRYFPKSEKFVLSSQIKNKALEFIGLVVKTNKLYNKKDSLLDCDVALEQIKVLIRIAKDMQYMKSNQYEHCSKIIAEIGKLLGGWIRAFG